MTGLKESMKDKPGKKEKEQLLVELEKAFGFAARELGY